MKDIARYEAGSLDGWIKNATMLAEASLLPPSYRGMPANILLAIQTGAPLGFGALESINGIHVIDGKPTMSADLMQASVRRAGHKLRVTGDDTYAEAVLIRADDPDFEFRVRWDMQRAAAAGLAGRGNWKKYPAAMLRSRAVTEVSRMGAADALHGVIYAPEELGADVGADGEPMAPTEPVAPRPQPAPTPAAAEQVEEAQVVEDVTRASGEVLPLRVYLERIVAEVASCESLDTLRPLYVEAQAAGVLGQLVAPKVTVGGLVQGRRFVIEGRGDEVPAEVRGLVVAAPAADEPVDAEVVDEGTPAVLDGMDER